MHDPNNTAASLADASPEAIAAALPTTLEWQQAVTAFVDAKRAEDQRAYPSCTRQDIIALGHYGRQPFLGFLKEADVVARVRSNPMASADDIDAAVYQIVVGNCDNDKGACSLSERRIGEIIRRGHNTVGASLNRQVEAGQLNREALPGNLVLYWPRVDRRLLQARPFDLVSTLSTAPKKPGRPAKLDRNLRLPNDAGDNQNSQPNQRDAGNAEPCAPGEGYGKPSPQNPKTFASRPVDDFGKSHLSHQGDAGVLSGCGGGDESRTYSKEELRYATPSRSRASAADDLNDDGCKDHQIILANWRTTKFFTEHPGTTYAGDVDAETSMAAWGKLLDRYGGAPKHLRTGGALQQAAEIAHEIVAGDMSGGSPVPAWHAMPAIAHAIARAHAERKRIRSLGFIAQRLVQMARDGDLTRIHDLPVTIDQGAFAEAHELATELVAGGRAWKQVTLHAEVLLSTTQVEALADLIKRYCRKAVADSLDLVGRYDRWATERQLICVWSWWEPAIMLAFRSAADEANEFIELDEILVRVVPRGG